DPLRRSLHHRRPGAHNTLPRWLGGNRIRTTGVFQCDRDPYSFSNLPKKERYRCRATRRSSVDTLSPPSHCFSKPDRSLAKPSASRCITAATSLSAPSTVRRGSSTKPFCRLLHCDRKSSISDSVNKGMGSETAPALSRASGSWPFTSLGPLGCSCAMPWLARSAVVSSPSFVFSSSITLPISFQQRLVPVPVPQTASDSESSPFSDLP